MKMYKYVFIVMSLCSLTCAKVDIHIDITDIKLVRSIVMRFCTISFVTTKGKEFLVKQKRFLYKLLGAARDPLTAHVAEALYPITKGYIAHQVDISPAGQELKGKPYKEWPATIHTIAPGMVMRDFKGKVFPYSHIKMQQGEIGITRAMVTSMAAHWQLAVIAALDTFLCNHDRHKGNLFYRMDTDTFCAIDMDSSYKYNLAELSYTTFRQLLKKPNFNAKEIKALIRYRNTLRFLLDTFSAQDIVDLYNRYLQEAGFIDGASFYTDKLKKLVRANKQVMLESYPFVEKIVHLLDNFLDTVKSNQVHDVL